MKNLALTFIAILLCSWQVIGQVVTTNPEFPTPDEKITIRFDASQGDRGLMNCNCDVYMHTGVLTDESTSITDWKFTQGIWGQDIPELKMSRTGSNTYQFEMESIRSFYEIPENVEVVGMTFVFRNVDGSQSGRADGGSDIVVDVVEEGALVLNIISPEGSPLVSPGETINWEVTSNAKVAATFTNTTRDEIIFQSELDSNFFAFDYIVQEDEEGEQNIEIILADNEGGRSQTFNTSYTVLGEQVVASLPANVLPGINRGANGAVTFVLEAPDKQIVFLDAQFSEDWPGSRNVQMNKTPDGRYFWVTVEGFTEEAWYLYRYVVDNSIIVADPYSEIIIDGNNDGFIPETVNNNFPKISANEIEGPVKELTAFRYEGFPYDWEVPNFQAPDVEDLFIYELLLRDFAVEHSYQTLIDTLDYLERLGVNAIELLPVNEFEGNISWGYNPSFHMALDKYYGDPITFKRFIDEAHKRGIAIIVDIVLNHAFSRSPLAQLYWNQGAFRPSEDNPWLNTVARHPFNVGYDFNHESQNTKDFVKRVTQFWIEEYKIDGYRYDLSKGFTQTQSSDDGVFRRFDQGRVNILQEMSDYVREVKQDAILILEHFGANDEEIELSNRGFLLWGNMHGAYKEGILGFNENNKSNIGGGYYRNRGWQEPHLVSFMESHDEQRQLYDSREFGASSGNYNVRDLGTGLDRTALAQTFLITIPGPKMIWMFGELGYDFPINYCEDGTIREDCRTGPKPIRWDYRSDADRFDLYNHIRDLNFLKKSFNMAFRAEPAVFNVTGEVKRIQTIHSDLTFFAVGNFGVQSRSVTEIFQEGGTYFDYFTGEQMTVSAGESVQMTLAPGQGHLWLNQEVTRPSTLTTSTNNFKISQDLKFYPNPVKSGSTITVEMEDISIDNGQLRIVDTRGVTVWAENIPDNVLGYSKLIVDLPQLSKGLYIMEIASKESRIAFVGKVIVE